MRLIILGAGGYGKTVADIARQSGKYEQIFFLVVGHVKVRSDIRDMCRVSEICRWEYRDVSGIWK